MVTLRADDKPAADRLYNNCTSSMIDGLGSSVIFSGALVDSARIGRAEQIRAHTVRREFGRSIEKQVRYGDDFVSDSSKNEGLCGTCVEECALRAGGDGEARNAH